MWRFVPSSCPSIVGNVICFTFGSDLYEFFSDHDRNAPCNGFCHEQGFSSSSYMSNRGPNAYHGGDRSGGGGGYRAEVSVVSTPSVFPGIYSSKKVQLP